MVDKIDSPSFVNEQYKNDNNLNSRINLHAFNTNKIEWNDWFFERMDIPEYSKILELGCGNGLLWLKNIEAINETLSITLSDFSEGMLKSANENLNNPNIKYEIIDIQDIPYADNSFDIIISRHMLYHVADIDKALSEVRRVLKPGGKFYVSTNGMNHMGELEKLVNEFNENIQVNLKKLPQKFGVENGEEYLKKHFNSVKLEEYNGEIVIDKVQPVVSYAMSLGSFKKNLNDKGLFNDFYRYVENEINKVGSLNITTKCGMFVAI